MAWERRRLAATTNEELIALNEELHQAGLQALANVELLGGPTGESIQDFHRLNEAWGMLDQTGQVTALATENYAQKLLEARDAGHELTEAQHAMADSAAKLNLLWDEAVPAAINAFEKSKQAGTSAYDKVMEAAAQYKQAAAAGNTKLMEKLIADNGSWVTNTKAAQTEAQEAQLAATAEVLAAEGDKFARMAAFEAALEAIRNGNAEGAAEAARKAAEETREAWDTAMDAVGLADQAASDAMAGTTSENQTKAEEEAKAKQRAETEAAKAASDAWEASQLEAVEDTEGAVLGIKEALDKLRKEHQIFINYHGKADGRPQLRRRRVGHPGLRVRLRRHP